MMAALDEIPTSSIDKSASKGKNTTNRVGAAESAPPLATLRTKRGGGELYDGICSVGLKPSVPYIPHTAAQPQRLGKPECTRTTSNGQCLAPGPPTEWNRMCLGYGAYKPSITTYSPLIRIWPRKIWMSAQRRFLTAKAKHRPKLKDWGKDGFATSREGDFLALRNLSTGFTDISNPTRALENDTASEATIFRVSGSNLSQHDFIQCFERPAVPCIISDIPTLEQWPADERWDSWSYFRCMKDSYFKVGEDDDGYSVKTRMRYFLDYMRHNKDDSPLYVFDSRFEEDRNAKCLLTDFAVPSYFPEDFFKLVGERRRPPYRWFLVGPARSGTCVHIDPLGTSAWNTVLRGRKRWVIFPPRTPKSIVKGLDVINKGEDDEAINYFVDILPRIKRKWGHEHDIIEFTQLPGDTVFIPGGWWHAVINLDDTVAVTQNYCSSENFERVWVRTRSGRKKMSVKLYNELKEKYPALAERADALNLRDNFEMYSKKGGSDIFDSKGRAKKRKKTDQEVRKHGGKKKKKIVSDD